MTATKKALVVGGVCIGVAVAWWLGSPLFITNRVSEELPGADTVSLPTVSARPVATVAIIPEPSLLPETLSQGTFTGFDALHQASGTARIISTNGKTYVRFEDDFTVTNGPDLFVHLGKNGKSDANANLGKLKGNEGSQNYEIPSSTDIANYSEVWVWCRAFSVPFGKAMLK